MPYINQNDLKNVFEYLPETGEFLRLITKSSNAVKGMITKGSKDHYGRYVLTINYKSFKAHRLAWIWMYGDIPDCKLIDHINGDHSDNRIANLRICTPHENGQNKKERKTKSGYGGVEKHQKGWRAYISFNYKKIHLGLYNTPEEAYKTHLEGKRNYHLFSPQYRDK